MGVAGGTNREVDTHTDCASVLIGATVEGTYSGLGLLESKLYKFLGGAPPKRIVRGATMVVYRAVVTPLLRKG